MVYAEALKLQSSWLLGELEGGQDEVDELSRAEMVWDDTREGMTPERGCLAAGFLFYFNYTLNFILRALGGF